MTTYVARPNSSTAPIRLALRSTRSGNSAPRRISTLSRQRRTPADASSIRLSAPNAMSERLWAAAPEPIATAASISIHPAVTHSRRSACLTRLARAGSEATNGFGKISALPPGRLVHHTQHFRPTSFEEAPHQKRRQTEERDVEPGRVIPSDGGFDHPCLALRRDKREAVKDQLDDQRRDCHSDVEGSEEEADHFKTVILAIDV